jgi:hypothetical protein
MHFYKPDIARKNTREDCIWLTLLKSLADHQRILYQYL